ncbi:MAG: cytochrome c maturation protein CcmE [Chloroflexi bacterium]|nr:cytochrome c maturation protein CcmE [Chloroflexota bacterium]
MRRLTDGLRPHRLSRRGRLVALFLVTTIAIGTLAAVAASSSLSYYVTPEEFAQEIDPEGGRWRVGGRVVPGTIVQTAGQPIAFEIQGEQGERMAISYDGVVPGLFGPRTFVVVEGVAAGAARLVASSVIIKHENEFVTDAADTDVFVPERSPSTGSP